MTEKNSPQNNTPNTNSNPESHSNFIEHFGIRTSFPQCNDPNAKKCRNCGARQGLGTIGKLYACSRCKTALYCDSHCQSFDWLRVHKYECQKQCQNWPHFF
jgi:hypothetical protein